MLSKGSEIASAIPMSVTGFLGHFGKKVLFLIMLDLCFHGSDLTVDWWWNSLLCTVWPWIRILFFFLLFWHMTTGSESAWRRAEFETKPVLPSIFHLGIMSNSAGPKKISEMCGGEQGQGVCMSRKLLPWLPLLWEQDIMQHLSSQHPEKKRPPNAGHA